MVLRRLLNCFRWSTSFHINLVNSSCWETHAPIAGCCSKLQVIGQSDHDDRNLQNIDELFEQVGNGV